MKILQIIGNLRGGGAERVALQLHRTLLKQGHQSQLWILEEDKTRHKSDINIVHVPAPQIQSRLIEQNYDLVIGHMQNVAELLQPYKHLPHLFFVVHTALYERLRRKSFFSRIKTTKKLKQIYHQANIITVSNGITHDIVQKLHFKPTRILHIPNPFNIKEIQNQANEPIQNRLDVPYLIGIGSLNSVKRHDIMLKSFAQMPDHLHLVLLGEGRKDHSLQKLAHRLGIAQRVHFKGWIHNPYRWIKHAKLLLHSSEAEGLPNVLIESLILHTPVVSTDCNHGPREILTGALAPYLAKVNNPYDLAQKAKAALESYPAITPDYYRRFDAESVARAYCALIDLQS